MAAYTAQEFTDRIEAQTSELDGSAGFVAIRDASIVFIEELITRCNTKAGSNERLRAGMIGPIVDQLTSDLIALGANFR